MREELGLMMCKVIGTAHNKLEGVLIAEIE